MYGEGVLTISLIANPSVAAEYATLKQALASVYRFDRDAYTEAKTDFIKHMTQVAMNALKYEK